MMKLFICLILAILCSEALTARILGLLPMPSRSHGILMEGLMRDLGNKGHHITYITASPPVQGPIPNLTVIHVPDVQKIIMQSSSVMKEQGSMLNLRGMSPWFMFFFSLAGPKMSDYILQEKSIQDIIKSDQEFDLILGEAFLDESLLAGFSHKFKAPIIGIMSFMPNIWGNYLTGNPVPTAYVPEPNMGYMAKMTFFQRLHNFLLNLAWEFHHPIIYLGQQDGVMRKHFGEDLPPIQNILRNTSMVLVNHHHALAFTRPYLPNMIEVGGMHINEVKPLPPAMKKYMDESKHGVILFSLGSNLRSADMSPEIISSILKAFGRLPYDVLWKFEKDDLENRPKNVKIDKWLPQSDLLAHPKMKLFITHGGLLSTTEAVHRGVPVIGIPIFGDQPLNMKYTENAGLGKTLNYDDISEDTLYNLITEVTSNPKYAEAAKFKSSIFKDNPQPPRERAVWWIEYVLRHKGAFHLRSASQDLCWFQLHQLDVIATLIAALVIVSYTILFILRKLWSLVCSKSNKKTSEKKKKN